MDDMIQYDDYGPGMRATLKKMHHCRLQADDDGGGDDGGLSGEQSTNLSDYGALLASLMAAAASVLSQNPFAISLEEAIYTLMICAFLLWAMFGGGSYFARWDMMDRNNLLYLKGLDQEEDVEDNKGVADFKAMFSSKSSRRVAMNFGSVSAIESRMNQ